jgi:hypothetical protein
MFAIQLHILPGAHSVRFLLPSSLLFMSPWPAPTPTDTRADCAKTARRISRARHPGPVPARLQARPRRTIALDAGTFVPSAHALFHSHTPRARRMPLLFRPLSRLARPYRHGAASRMMIAARRDAGMRDFSNCARRRARRSGRRNPVHSAVLTTGAGGFHPGSIFPLPSRRSFWRLRRSLWVASSGIVGSVLWSSCSARFTLSTLDTTHIEDKRSRSSSAQFNNPKYHRHKYSWTPKPPTIVYFARAYNKVTDVRYVCY